jgi:Circadian oscillating protein COP23
MKSFKNHLQSLLSIVSLPIAIAIIGNASSVNALPINTSDSSKPDNFRQLLSQSNQEPPDVIINDSQNSTSTSQNSSSSSSSTSTSTTQTRNGDTRFTCEVVDGEYTVMYYPESDPNSGYPWAIPGQLGGGWTPEKRCNEITRRFESYRQDGLLELTTGVENNYDTICVTTQVDPRDCRIVLTVPPGQDPQQTRDLIFDNLLVADDGQQTQGVYTYGDNQSGNDILNEVGKVLGGGSGSQNSPKNIDLRPFLDPADGGTGKELRQGNSVAPKPSRSNTNEQRQPALFK